MIVFRTPVDVEELGARAGDFLVLDPRDLDLPVSVVRSAPPEALKVLVRLLPQLERVDVVDDTYGTRTETDVVTESLMKRLTARDGPLPEVDPKP